MASSSEVGCGEALGLERGLVTDSQISSSLAASGPERGRLNNPEAAWCFEWSKLNTTNLGSEQARHLTFVTSDSCLSVGVLYFIIAGDLLASRSVDTDARGRI